LARTTGNNSLDTMSGPELLAVSQALNRLPDPKPESAPIILPEGTNAKLFKQSQYDSAVRAVDTALSGQGLSLTPGPMTEQATLDVIKQATGLTLDKHAKAILDTAVKQGDFDLEMTPRYEVTDPATGVRVGDLYETRKEAQAAAKPKGLNVNEITESAVVAPKTATVLPDEFDIQEGEFKTGETPESFDIMAGNTVLANTTSYEDAAGRIEGFTKIRKRMADQALARVTKLQEEIANSQSDLEQMEARGEANTQEYINARGAHAKLLKEQEVKTNEAFDEADKYNPETNPISIKPRKLAPVRRRGLTVLQKGIPSATFPTRTAAEEHIIANMSDQQLKKLTKTEGRRTLAKRALAELQAREDKKAGITKGIAVKRSEVEGEPEVSQEVKDKIAELEKFLLPALRKLGLNDVALKIEQSIAGGRAGGSYYKSLIKIAMDEENPLLTMRHEALHALKALGFFTPQQWATLERKARTEWVNKYLLQRNADGKPIKPNEASRYDAYERINIIEPTVWNRENPDKPQRTVMSQADFMDLIIEEAIADAFADFTVNKPPPGMIAALMQRLNKFFEALRNAMAGAGFQTVDDIFGKVEAGELKALGQGPAEAKTKLSVTAEKIEEVDPKDVGNIVTNSAYKDAGINVLGSQIEKTSKPLEVDDVGKLFDDAYMAEFGKAGDWRNPVDFKRAVVQAVDELKVQMQQAKSGLDWYDEDVAEAFKLTQRYIPSLKNPEKRALFSVIAGIMSPSTNARDNWVIAAQAYQHYEKTGTLPGTNPATGGLWMGGLESANKKKQLDMLNAMLQPKSKIQIGGGGLGEKGAIEWLQGVHTVAEINQFRAKYGGMGKSSTGGKATDILPGFTAFGPKVGPFVMNINGIHEVTVDVWMTRTFNRYFGQMMGPDGKMVRAPTEPQRVAIKNLAVLAAQQLGIKPYQVQSMLWFMEQQIFNKLGTGAKSYGFSDGATKFSETQGGVGVSKVPPANIGANATANKPTRKQAVGSGVQAGKLSVRSTGQEVTDENIRSAKPTVRPSGGGNEKINYGPKYSLRGDIRSYRAGDEETPTHTARSLGDAGGVRVLGAKPITQYTPANSFKGIVSQYGYQSPAFYEISGKDADVYEQAIQDAKNSSPYGAAVYVYPVDEYANMRLFLTEDGKSGFALKGDDIVSVFSGPPHKGSVNSSIQLAVQEGGRRLDAFDTVLTDIYHANGFQIVGRMNWNEEYKPDDWDKQTFSKFNSGEPDVVYMAYNPDDNRTIFENPGEYFDDPDELAQAQRDAVNAYYNEGTGYGSAQQAEASRRLKAQTGTVSRQRGVRRGVQLLDEQTRAKYPGLEEPVKGLPATVKVDGVDVTFGPYIPAREAAVLYAEESGLPYRQQSSYHKLDPEFSKMLASSYARMIDEPNAPQVKAAYKAWADETIAQYKAMLKTGITVEFFPDAIDTYGNPRNSILDVLNNNHLYVFPADGGFGKDAITDEQIRSNPALALTDIVISGRRARVVEVFRATHDFYGHIKEGFGFRAEGEENAFQSHVRMYSPLAARAMTAGTRGQNSEVNFGPNADFNKTASGKDTKYADQKIGLLPEWASTMEIEPDIVAEPASVVTGKGVVLGTLQPGAASFKGAHYGNAKVNTLNGDKYGTGIRGAESKRLAQSNDERINRRVYFYTQKPDGTMPIPEAGLGQYVYTQQFDNILPPGVESDRLSDQAKGNSNDFESLVVDAGYDGYAIPNMGMMVILNHNAPVEYRGTRVEMAERGEKLSVRPPPLIGRISPNTPEFKRFFDGSKAINDDGSPRLMFHGTVETPGEEGNLFSAFNLSDDGKLGSGVYTTSVPVYAETFGFSQPALMPLYLSAKNPYNIDLGDFPTRMKGGNLVLTDEAFNALETQMKEAATKLSGKRLMDLEGSQVRKMFEKAGYDSIIAKDSFGNIIEALAFKPEQVKSATGNVGTFDPTNPDIRYSLRAPDTKEFKQWFGSSKVVNADGTPRVVYHGTTKDFDTPKTTYKREEYAKFGFHVGTEEAANTRLVQTEGLNAKGANIMPVYVKAENPLRIDENRLGRWGIDDIMSEVMEKADKGEIDGISPDAIEDFFNDRFDIEAEVGVEDNLAEPRVWQDEDMWMPGERSNYLKVFLQQLGYDSIVYNNEFEGGGDSYILLDPRQVKSATGNKGTYNPENPDIRLSVRNIIGDQKVIDAYLSKTTAREEKGHAARMLEAITPPTYTSLRQMFLNQYDSLARLDNRYAKAKGIVRLMADSSAEAAALMSDMAAGVAARVIGMGGSPGGAPVYRNGATYIDNKNGTIKGPAEIFAPLAKRNDPEIYQAYQYWAGVQRGSRYMQNPNGTYEEKLFNDPSDIAYANHLLDKFPEFKQVQADWNVYNDGLVDYMVSTGVISKQAGAEFKKHGDYIPFYRQLEGEETIGPKVFQNISGVKPPKKAKGGEAPLADFLETVVRNTQAAIQSGMKNAAAVRTVDMLGELGETTKIPKPSGINTVSLLRDGKVEHYHVNDPLLVDSLKSLNLAKLPGLGFLSGPANLLRSLVTKDPGFMLANLMRDSMSAWVTSGQNFKPGIDTIRYFGKALAGNSPEVEALLNFGMGGYEFSKGVEQSGRDLADTLKKKTQGPRTFGQKVLNVGPSIWEALEKGTTASDMATRAAIYKKVMEETGNETEALMRALEVMNFNRRGNSVVVRIATAAIPFFNARMQGLDVLYRAGIRPYIQGKDASDYEKQVAKTFAIRGLTMMAVSSLYWAMTHDDDEYLAQEQETRDNNWLLPSLGMRVPIPFEVGVLFKVIPERLLELSFGNDTGKDFSEAMVRNIKSSLFMDLMPQTIKPIYEVTTNYNFYTRRPIVGQGAEGLASVYEVGPGTSSFAEGIGKMLGFSPLKVDHLIKAYTGTIGMYAVDTIDLVIDANSDVPKATKRFEQMPFIKRFALDAEARGKVTAYYDLKNSVDEVVRTVNHLEKAGNYEEMGEYMQDNMRILASKDYISALEKEMKSFREVASMIRNSRMSGDEKRDALLAVTQAQNKLTGNIQEIKKMIASGD